MPADVSLYKGINESTFGKRHFKLLSRVPVKLTRNVKRISMVVFPVNTASKFQATKIYEISSFFSVFCTKGLLVSYYYSETADNSSATKRNFHDKPQQVFDQHKLRSP